MSSKYLVTVEINCVKHIVVKSNSAQNAKAAAKQKFLDMHPTIKDEDFEFSTKTLAEKL